MATTRTTTRPDAANPVIRVLAAVTLALAVALVCYAALWLVREGGLMALHATARDIRYGRTVPLSELARRMPEIITKDAAHGLGAGDLDDAALVASLFAERQRDNRLAAPALWVMAERLTRERLALAPADGNSWLRLAYIRSQRFGLDPLARRALRLSWLVTPREISVMRPGLQLRMAHWQELTPDEKDAAADLVAGLWHKPPARAELLAYWLHLPADQRAELLAIMRDPPCRAALTAPAQT